MTSQQEHPDRVVPLPMDVTDEASVQAAAKRISDETGERIDVLLNTAGILHDQHEPTSEVGLRFAASSPFPGNLNPSHLDLSLGLPVFRSLYLYLSYPPLFTPYPCSMCLQAYCELAHMGMRIRSIAAGSALQFAVFAATCKLSQRWPRLRN